MAAGDDDVIETAVVKISPDLSGFARKLRADLDKAIKGPPEIVAKIKLVPAAGGFNTAAGKALKAQTKLKGRPEYKIKLVADARGFNTSATAALKQQAALKGAPTYKVKLVVDDKDTKAAASKVKNALNLGALGADPTSALNQRMAARRQAQQDAAYLLGLRQKTIQSELTQLRNKNEAVQRAELAAQAQRLKQVSSYEDYVTRLHDIGNRRNRAIDAFTTRAAEVEGRRRIALVEREAAREAAARRKATSQLLTGPKLLDLGAKGIRPTHLLYASLAALVPVLFAVGSSALQASTSIAALGAGAYGASLGIIGLVTAFKGLQTLLALRKTVLAEQATKAANAGRKASTKATKDVGAELSAREALLDALDAQVSARDAVADAQRRELKAQLAINVARKESIRDLADLKQRVAELQNQQRADVLSVAEARQRQRSVESNFFASTLEKARAVQDVRDALVHQSGTRLDLKENSEDLRTLQRKGVAGSDKVVAAREAAADAVRDVASARRAAAGAARNVANARRRRATEATAATATLPDATSSAQANLDRELAQHSQALREMYHWIAANDKLLKGFRNRIEQAILPGFLTFLKDITKRSKGADSTVDVLVDGVVLMGRKISDTVAKFGKIAKTDWFKGQLKTLNTETGKSFDHLSGAALKLVKPLTQITVAAAPLLTKFSGWLEKLAGRFAKVIDKANANGGLKDWFDKASKSASVWGDIVGNILTTLKNLFTLSLPTGDNLVQRFADLTEQVADWSKSGKGQGQITKFFEFFKDINYGDVAGIVGSLTELFVAFKLVMLLKAGPLTLLVSSLTTFMTSHPGGAAAFLESMTKFLNVLAGPLLAHPEVLGGILAIIAATKTAKALNIGVKLPGVDNLRSYLTGKFKVLDTLFGGQKLATMTVHAGVVNIHGAVSTGGAPGVLPGGKLGNAGKVGAGAGATILGGVEAAGVSNIVAAAVVFGLVAGFQEFKKGVEGGKYHSWADALTKQPLDLGNWWDTFIDNSAAALIAALLRGARGDKNTPVPADPGADLDRRTKQYRLDHPFATDREVADWRREQGRGTPNNDRPGRLAQAVKTEAEAFAQLNKVAPAAVATQQLNNEVTADAFKPLQDYITARKNSTQAAYDADIATGNTVQAEKNYAKASQDSIDTLTVELTNLGWTDKAARDYAESLFSIPPKRETVIKQPTMKQVLADTQDLWDKLEGVDGNWVAHISQKGGPEVAAQLLDLMTQQYVLMNPTATDAQVRDERRERARMFSAPVHAAEGGHVRGPGTPTSDSIPAMLSRDEYVQPAHATAYYGVDFMDRLRKHQIPRMADGGLIDMPFTLDLSQTQTSFPTLAGLYGGVPSGDLDVAETAERTARAMGATTKQLIALIEAGLVESGLRNLPYGDRDSVGFLQQRASWGSRAQRMNVAEATRKFISKARRVDAAGLTAGQLAQAVQVSAFPARYDQRAADAAAVLNRMAPFLPGYGYGEGGGGGGGTQAGLVAFGRSLQARGYDVSEHPAFGGVRGRHADGSQHYRGNAIDVNHGAGTSAREQAYLRKIIPEAHLKGFRTLFMVPGHYDHAHVDLGAGHRVGGLVRTQQFDSGGLLEPGVTLAVNNTRRPERVLTSEQETQALAPQNLRLDRRDLSALAGYIVTAIAGQSIAMDGRKVAETVRGYDYLPRGI